MIRSIVLGVLLVTLGCGVEHESSAAETTRDITNLIGQYARSINAADTGLAAEVWLTSSDVSFIHPLGHEHGWDSIKANVYEKLMAGMFSERRLVPRDIVVHPGPYQAWAEFYWDFSATSKKDGAAVSTHGRETQIYQRFGDRWKLVHVHYSAMPN